MQITIFSVWMTFVWCSIFIVLCYILRKRSVLLNLSSMTGIIILYLFCLINQACRPGRIAMDESGIRRQPV